jgi:hypothetical protein
MRPSKFLARFMCFPIWFEAWTGFSSQKFTFFRMPPSIFLPFLNLSYYNERFEKLDP